MPDTFKYAGERKSHQTFNEIYFRLIKDWKHLLTTDDMKMIIIGSKFYETGEDDPLAIGFKILTHLMDKIVIKECRVKEPARKEENPPKIFKYSTKTNYLQYTIVNSRLTLRTCQQINSNIKWKSKTK